MSSFDQYSCILSVHVEHEYYGDSLIPVELIPEDQTAMYLRKYDIQVKRMNNSWNLYSSTRTSEFFKEDNEFLSFAIKPLNNTFYFVSEQVSSTDQGCKVVEEAVGIPRRIDIAVERKEVTVSISSLSKYFEYIVFPTKNSLSKDFTLIDARRMVEFDSPQIILWENGEKVLQFLSKDKVKLTEKSAFNLRMIEKSKFGERVVLSNVLRPRPQSASIYNPQKAITAYYTV